MQGSAFPGNAPGLMRGSSAVWSGPRAVGILIFPKIVKAGFIFGAQGGKGAPMTAHFLNTL